LQLSLDKVLQVTGRERGYIRLKEPITSELVLAAYRGISKEYADTLLFNRTLGGKSDQVFETGRSLIINDPQGTTLKKETLDEGIRSIAWVPLKAAGKVVGILNISTAFAKSFEPREVELLEAIANVIGNAVENSRLFLETLARAKEISALYDVSTTVNRSLDLDSVLQEVLRKIMDIFHFDATRAYLFRPETEELRMCAALHTSSGPPPQMRLFRPGQGHIGKVFKTNESIIYSDVRQGAECEVNSLTHVLQNSGFNFFAAFPIRSQLEPVGVLSCIGKAPRCLTPAEIRLLTLMTDQIGISVVHARLYEETKKQAVELEKTNTELSKRENVQSLLKELSLDITSLDIDQLLNKLSEKARDFFAADVCSVRVKDGESWRLMGVSGTAPDAGKNPMDHRKSKVTGDSRHG
jgi:GAF domain-containing protein